jgi:UDP-N-acetylmuramoyl-L-alanyl-D-glutamate--2,6-diaminopimelate ligase
VYGCASDSRHVSAGNLFVCKGAAFDPAYLAAAARAGAVAYLCEPALLAACQAAAPALPALTVPSVRAVMGHVAAAAWLHPDKDLACVGITGTKGKSTATWMLRSILEAAGQTPCYLGSIETFDGVERFESVNTTPEAPDLYRHLANARACGLTTAVLEVSSQALKYGRVTDIAFCVGALLNLGLDHISPAEHPTFEDYVASKLAMYAQSETALVNLDCLDAAHVLNAAHDAGCNVITFAAQGAEKRSEDGEAGGAGVSAGASDRETAGSEGTAPTYRAHSAHSAGTGIAFTLETPEGPLALTLAMGGYFNVENATAAAICARELGISWQAIVQGLATCEVPGRMTARATRDGRIACLIDYAHNELSFEKFFESLRTQYPSAWVVAYFGAGGGKAFNRREELPRIASQHANYLIFTEDDPAHESAAAIGREMAAHRVVDVPYEIEPIRERAGERAFALACEQLEAEPQRQVVVCALGKGSEALMHRGDEFIPYTNDVALLEGCIAAYDEKNAG